MVPIYSSLKILERMARELLQTSSLDQSELLVPKGRSMASSNHPRQSLQYWQQHSAETVCASCNTFQHPKCYLFFFLVRAALL